MNSSDLEHICKLQKLETFTYTGSDKIGKLTAEIGFLPSVAPRAVPRVLD